MEPILEFNYLFEGDEEEHIINIQAKSDSLLITIELESKGLYWYKELNSKLLSEITSQMGSYKSLKIFTDMLIQALAKKNKSLSLNFYSLKEIQDLSNFSLENKEITDVKKFLILVYTSFEKVIYPIPMDYLGNNPTKELMQRTIIRLRNRISKLKEENKTLSNNSSFNKSNLSINNIYNNNDSDTTLSIKNKYKSLLKEIKILNNNSRIKFKKLYDNLSNEYDKILSSVYDYLQKGNTKLVIDRLNRVEQLKNDVLFDVTSIENIQNKFIDSIKNIFGKINVDKSDENKDIRKNNNNARHSLGRTKTGFTFHKNNNKSFNFDFNFNNSENNLYNKLSKNKILDINNYTTYGNMNTISGSDISKFNYNNNKDENNECIKVYRIKLKEKKSEIERLKQQLQEEKESKNKVIKELNKLEYSNKMSLNLKNSQKNLTVVEKFNKLTEMIIGFTYSMNNLRNNLYQKTISHIDAKNIYGKLKTKLIALIEEVSSVKNEIKNNKEENLGENLNEENNENIDDIKTIKEENENSQIFTDRDKDFIKNDDENNIYNDNQTVGNIVNNNITLNTLPNYNMEVLIEENKNLRNQLSQKIYNSSENESNNQQDKNLVESLKQQIIELKKKIMEKDLELEEKRNENIRTQKDDLNNIIINNSKNIEQLKMTYQLLIDDKDNRIKELEEEIISYEKEIDLLKEENDKLKSESRKDKILSEAEVNNLKNQKIELQCLLEQGNSNNNLINLNKDDKEKIKKMENELNIKNKQITLLTQNHENDLKELNLAIEMLKQKIIQLEEENYNLSLEKNKAIEKNE